MRRLFIVLSVCLCFLFCGCSFVEQFKKDTSHPVERVLCITPDLPIIEKKLIDPATGIKYVDYYLAASLGETFICTYNFAPDFDYNCNSIKVTFSNDEVLELLDISIEDKQFRVKSISNGLSNITVLTNDGDHNTTLAIEVN